MTVCNPKAMLAVILVFATMSTPELGMAHEQMAYDGMLAFLAMEAITGQTLSQKLKN